MSQYNKLKLYMYMNIKLYQSIENLLTPNNLENKEHSRSNISHYEGYKVLYRNITGSPFIEVKTCTMHV